MLRFIACGLILIAAPVYGAVDGEVRSKVEVPSQDLAWPKPGEYVKATLKDSRTIQGIVTSETTSETLALSRTLRGLTTESETPKSKIASIEKQSPPELKLDDPAAPASELPAQPLGTTHPPRRSSPRIVSLAVRARLANWDADPQPDGLLIEVSPLDAAGNFVPVAGNIDLTLYGERHQQGGKAHDDRAPFFILEKTTRLLRVADASKKTSQEIGSDAYYLRLPFRNFDPNRDFSIGEFGILQARLSVPGQGVFKASDDWTQIRDSSRTRDNLQQLTGRRYLPTESR